MFFHFFYKPKTKCEFQPIYYLTNSTSSGTLAEKSQDHAVNSSTPMQSLYLIRVEKQGKHVACLIHSSHAP